jgi:hypothetical protein
MSMRWRGLGPYSTAGNSTTPYGEASAAADPATGTELQREKPQAQGRAEQHELVTTLLTHQAA